MTAKYKINYVLKIFKESLYRNYPLSKEQKMSENVFILNGVT